METVNIRVKGITPEQFQSIKSRIKEYWGSDLRYDAIESSEDEGPIVTFYVTKEQLNEFVEEMFFIGVTCGMNGEY